MMLGGGRFVGNEGEVVNWFRPRSFMRLDAARHDSWMEVDRLSK